VIERWFYRRTQIGNVVLSEHAQRRLFADQVTDEQVEMTLNAGRSTKDGQTTILRQWRDIRLVIETQPDPPSGASVCITGYRVKP